MGVFIVSASILLVAGIISIVISLILKKEFKRKVEDCVCEVQADVIDFSYIRNRDESYWIPTYGYYFEGVWRKVKGKVGVQANKLRVGQSLKIYVNPKNEDEIYVPEEGEKDIINILFAVGCILIFVSVLLITLIVLGIFSEVH